MEDFKLKLNHVLQEGEREQNGPLQFSVKDNEIRYRGNFCAKLKHHKDEGIWVDRLFDFDFRFQLSDLNCCHLLYDDEEGFECWAIEFKFSSYDKILNVRFSKEKENEARDFHNKFAEHINPPAAAPIKLKLKHVNHALEKDQEGPAELTINEKMFRKRGSYRCLSRDDTDSLWVETFKDFDYKHKTSHIESVALLFNDEDGIEEWVVDIQLQGYHRFAMHFSVEDKEIAKDLEKSISNFIFK